MHITYLFDPLCGWCYGAGPALERLAARDDVTLDLAPTGLFAGEGARVMDAGFAAYAWQNDQRIARLTGQSFSERYRADVLGGGGLFDSAPATLAIVAVGLDAPQRELAVLKALQHARYIDGRDTTTLAAVATILAEMGLPKVAVRVAAPDSTLLAAYNERTRSAHAELARFGAQGVPALLVGDGTARRLLPAGALFGDLDSLTSQLQAA